MAINARQALRQGAGDLASKRGGVIYLLFAVFSLLSVPLHHTLTRETTEWIVATADVPREQVGLPATPFALDLSIPVLVGGLIGVFLFAEVLRLVAVRSFASDSLEAIPIDEVTTGGVGTLVVLLAASVLVQVAVYGGILLFVLPGLVAVVLTLFVRQAILLDDDGIVDAFRTSASTVVGNAVHVLLIMVALIALSLVLGVPTTAIDPESLGSPVLGTLLGTITTVYGIAVITRAYQQVDDGDGQPLGPDDLEDDSLESDETTVSTD